MIAIVKNQKTCVLLQKVIFMKFIVTIFPLKEGTTSFTYESHYLLTDVIYKFEIKASLALV